MNTVLQADSLTIDGHYSPLSIAIPQESITAVVGPLRSGKSELLLALAGISPPQAGELKLFGMNPHTISKDDWLELRRRVGYVLPNSSLVSHLTALNNVILPINYHKLAEPDQVEHIANELLDWLECEADTSLLPSALSEHDKRIVNIARALSLKPKLLYIDEAFAYLDILKKKRFIERYDSIRRDKNITLVLATHDLAAATECADQFIFLAENEILWFASAEELQASNNECLQRYRAGIGL